VITDRTVSKLHRGNLLAAGVEKHASVLEISPGEASKTLATVEMIYNCFSQADLGRDGVVVALGGGVVGDVAGFAAATWMRGVGWIQVPTTLEAAIDASVGGKTGVNHDRGKNLIGAFHQPEAVLVDTDFLATLPDRDFVAGLAESVKHALIQSSEFLEWHDQNSAAIVARDLPETEELIYRNCAIKAAVVGQDEREQGLREILNFGHTVGHAIEHALRYDLRHGECVGLGMLVANEISRSRGWMAREACAPVRQLLVNLGLPVRLPRSINPAEILAACRLDKKTRDGVLRFVLLRRPGEAIRGVQVSDEEIVAALGAVAAGAG
jgi:3-dehydroquinate synthase